MFESSVAAQKHNQSLLVTLSLSIFANVHIALSYYVEFCMPKLVEIRVDKHRCKSQI